MAKRPKVSKSQQNPKIPASSRRDEVLDKIARASTVVRELNHNPGWEILLEDFSTMRDRIDDSWHLVDPTTKAKELNELRVTKLAIGSILQTYDSYVHDLATAEKELYSIDNKDKVISKDFDED